jgi:hypothetical protein
MLGHANAIAPAGCPGLAGALRHPYLLVPPHALVQVLAEEGKSKAIAFDEIDKAPEEKARGITIATAHGASRAARFAMQGRCTRLHAPTSAAPPPLLLRMSFCWTATHSQAVFMKRLAWCWLQWSTRLTSGTTHMWTAPVTLIT